MLKKQYGAVCGRLFKVVFEHTAPFIFTAVKSFV